jgi:glycosyltransferase involved in cell wall biosynthesis
MNILHVWDQAGVACILAKYQRRLGHNVSILKRKGYDPFDIFTFYKETLYDLDGKKFINFVIEESKNFDIIHIHSLYKIVPQIRKKYKDKIIIIHYHGSELRNGLIDHSLHKLIEEVDKKSNLAFLATPDLIKYESEKRMYIENPVDMEHFKPMIQDKQNEDTFLAFKTNQIDINALNNYLQKNNIKINLTIHDRTINPISYTNMPSFLSNYSVYVDIKIINNKFLESLSKTALEALACNLKVLSYDLKYLNDFPTKHKAENVVEKMMTLIESL